MNFYCIKCFESTCIMWNLMQKLWNLGFGPKKVALMISPIASGRVRRTRYHIFAGVDAPFLTRTLHTCRSKSVLCANAFLTFVDFCNRATCQMVSELHFSCSSWFLLLNNQWHTPDRNSTSRLNLNERRHAIYHFNPWSVLITKM